jgi:predicted MFS family arabinose efflux permease
LSGSLCSGTLALFVPFTYLPEVAETAGVDAERAAYLVAAGGLSSSLGRVLAGWMSDEAWCCPLALTTLAVALAALQPILITW